MAETLTTPDVVDLVRSLLEARLPSMPAAWAVGVHRAVPAPRPPRFVTVRLTGGAGRTAANPVTDQAQVTVEAWGDKPEGAHDLAQDARAAVHAAQGTVLGDIQVYRVQDGGPPVDLPDPLSDQHRCTFTVSLTVRTRRSP